ncbi:MAG: YdcF family protein [Neisseriaceae bacterium]|nr:YdcF family protein [Neisseriaceae bacterium]
MRLIAFIKKILKTLLYMSLVVFFLIVFLCGWVVWQGQERQLQTADAAIVLGAAAWGNKPSPVFTERIRHAVNLYHAGVVRKLIFTGGTPKDGFATEAEVGERWAIQHGVLKEDIFVEKTSRNTLYNLKNAADVAKNNNLSSFIIVSDPYHLARAKLMAKHLNLQVQLSSTPTSRFNNMSWYSKLRILIHEAYGIVLYYIFHLLEIVDQAYYLNH